MKRIIKYIFIGLLGCFLMACQREELPPTTNVFVDSVSITPSYVDAEVSCKIRSSITIEYAALDLSTEPDFANAKEIVLTRQPYNHYTATLKNLSDGMTYYVRYKVSNTFSTVIHDKIDEFHTLTFSLPILSTTEVTEITFNSAHICGVIENDGGKKIHSCGIVYGTSSQPTIENAINVKASTSSSTISSYISHLEEGVTYYARTYAANELGITYGKEISFIVDPLWCGFDLGLSVKWAHMNVGAEKIDDYGDYFAWGETNPKTSYYSSNYSFYEEWGISMNKYHRYVDGMTILEPIDDVATEKWGGNWRMPTDLELKELYDKCSWTLTSINGITGYKVTSKINGVSIFLPCAGYIYGEAPKNKGTIGYYWSSTLAKIEHSEAQLLMTMSGLNNMQRCYGLSVRPVCP